MPVAVVGLMCVAWLAVSAQATPVRPDLRRMLAQPPASQDFVPARAGWQGPETPTPADAQPNPLLEKFGEVSSARVVRASIVAAATPDPRIAVVLLAAILLLRWLRHSRGQRKLRPGLSTVAAAEPPPTERAA